MPILSRIHKTTSILKQEVEISSRERYRDHVSLNSSKHSILNCANSPSNAPTTFFFIVLHWFQCPSNPGALFTKGDT